jgi:hypothetical protein
MKGILSLSLCVSAFVAITFVPSMSRAESIVLDDTSTVFDGGIFGAAGCNPEFPLIACQFFNMGGQPVFSVGKTGAHISTAWRALMGFDLSAASGIESRDVDSAVLTLTAVNVTNSDSLLYIGFQSLNYDVIEGDCEGFTEATDSSFTWSARIFKEFVDTVLWQSGGAKGSEDREDSIYAVSPPMGDVGAYRIDVTDLIQHWLDSTATRRWCVLGDTVQLAGGRALARKMFHSSEGVVPSGRPKLEIFYHSSGLKRSGILSGGLLK